MFILVKIFVLVYNTPMTIEEKISQLLQKKKLTLGLAESCSGGLLAHRITQLPGSSDILKGSIIAYCNEIKTNVLKVNETLISKHGAVSSQVAIAMAKNVRKLLKSDFGISITGIAGPAGGTKRKPVGLTFIAISTPDETLCLECQFTGNRSSVKTQSTKQALHLLLEFLDE